jgi:hypothetical protein
MLERENDEGKMGKQMMLKTQQSASGKLRSELGLEGSCIEWQILAIIALKYSKYIQGNKECVSSK